LQFILYAVHLKNIILTNFKNYESQALEFSPFLNCFSGFNGMGKTNILDAIYYLCLIRSRFGLLDHGLCRKGTDFFRLEGHFQRAQDTARIVAKVQPRKKKQIECNDVPYPTISDHVGQFPVVFIGPDDTTIISEGSEERRRFVDNTLSQLSADYLRKLMQYNKLLQQRNALLKQGAEQRRFDQALMHIYDEQLVPLGMALYRYRVDFMDNFSPLVQQTYARIAGDQESIALAYQSALHTHTLAELLSSSREKDKQLQRTSEGIHRDDLALQINGMPLKRFGSQGQLKSFVLALKLAQYKYLEQEKKIKPMLLLDDIFDKLDALRVAQLLQLLHMNNFGQVFITDTDEIRVSGIIREFDADFRHYRINSGQAQVVTQTP
jgi:DNA replication and repair protein RecF